MPLENWGIVSHKLRHSISVDNIIRIVEFVRRLLSITKLVPSGHLVNIES